MRFIQSLLIFASFAASLFIQSLSAEPAKVSVAQQVLPLPGKLDDVPVFNSNSPEVVQSEGVLLSTFPQKGKEVPEAHLNRPLDGRFDVFFHHIANATKTRDLRTLYLGFLLENPGTKKVTVRILQAASYLSRPDAPFGALPPVVANDQADKYAGPGDRVVLDILRRHRQKGWPAKITLAPGQKKMLFALPIPVRDLDPPLNGRSGLLKLKTDGPVYAAMLAAYGQTSIKGYDLPPALETWQRILATGQLAGPRDIAPSAPGTRGMVVYGRVSGVNKGSTWQAEVVNDSEGHRLSISPGQVLSYVVSTVTGGTLGTGQVQSAPMMVRFPDTAYEAHGNYGVTYDLSLPIYNASDQPSTVTLTFQTPIKQSDSTDHLLFYDSPTDHVFFRGTVRFEYKDDRGKRRTKYFHLVEEQGQQMDPLITLRLKAHERRLVNFSFLYPPDATPPQVVTVQSEPASD